MASGGGRKYRLVRDVWRNFLGWYEMDGGSFPAGTVFYHQRPPRTTISYWYEMVEKTGTRNFGYEMSETHIIRLVTWFYNTFSS